MTTLKDLKKAVYEWLTQVLGIPVIEAHQAARRPSKPYACFMIGVERRVGARDEWQGLDDDEVASWGGMRVVTVGIQVFGPEALQKIRNAEISLNTQGVLAQFYHDHQIAVVRTEPILNLTQLLETEWEERGQMDVIFAYSVNYTEAIPRIQTVEISGKVDDLEIKQTLSLP